jgi:hypothetical protein
MRGYNMSDAPDQYPDRKCPECGSTMVPSHQNVFVGVSKAQKPVMVFTKPAEQPKPEPQPAYTGHDCGDDCPRDHYREWKDEQSLKRTY